MFKFTSRNIGKFITKALRDLENERKEIVSRKNDLFKRLDVVKKEEELNTKMIEKLTKLK